MRPFGHAMDLDLDFGQPDRPALVTTLLTCCGEQGDADFWWSQTVSTRTTALLRLVAVTEQRDDLRLGARCAEAGCGDSFEFTLPLLSLPAVDDHPLDVRLDDERTLLLRRPTGQDLRRWREAQPASRPSVLLMMLDSLVLAGHAGPDDEGAVAASMTAMDPLVDFIVSCCCPACGTGTEVAIDLEALALARLAARQRTLLREVHRLASSYGWTESEALAVPPARRAEYLRLIEAQS